MRTAVRSCLFIAALACMGSVFAQNVSQSGGLMITSNIVTSPAVGTVMRTSGDSTLIWGGSNGWTCTDRNCWSSGDTETRLAKAPGFSIQQIKGSRHPVAKTVLATPEYMKLAKSIKLTSPAVATAEMAQIITDHGFLVYDFDKVDNYLYHEALKQGTQVRWVWKPMREADSKLISDAQAGVLWTTNEGMGRVSGSVYAHAIPERVLEKVQCLLDEMPDAIFMVSDYEVVRPDPFLAVTTKKMLQDHKIFIVEQWDEPGFKDKPRPAVDTISAPIQFNIAGSKIRSLDGR